MTGQIRGLGRHRRATGTAIRVIGDPQRTCLVVDLEKSPDYGVQRLSSPYRVVVDMPDVEFAESAPLAEGRGLIAGFRYSLVAPHQLADILFDLARRETKNSSIHFAKMLVEGKIGSLPMNSNPSRRASFKVLTAPEVPSVLLELGFVSNKDDKARFRTDNWPAKEAKAVAVSIEKFIDERAEKALSQEETPGQ